LIGCIAIMAGELSYSSGALYAKHVQPRFAETTAIALNAAQMMYGGGLLLLVSVFTERIELDTLTTTPVIGSLLYLIVFGSMLGHSIFYWLVAKTNPVFPSTWLYVSPLIAMALGVLWYGETVSWVAMIGVATILMGIVLINLEPLMSMLRRRTKDAIISFRR
jgi:drug/metabolite transporter (DMT)-like permease